MRCDCKKDIAQKSSAAGCLGVAQSPKLSYGGTNLLYTPLIPWQANSHRFLQKNGIHDYCVKHSASYFWIGICVDSIIADSGLPAGNVRGENPSLGGLDSPLGAAIAITRQ